MLYLIWLYVAFFAVFTAIHLYASYRKKDSLRGPTKMVILLAILGMYLEWAHYQGADPSVFVVFALITSWLGDVLLIPKGVKWFTAGGISFWISHFLFIFAYIESGIVFSRINPIVAVAIALVYAITVVILFSKLKAHLPKPLFYPMFLYLLTNGAMNVFAWFRLLSGSCTLLGGILTGIGALMFFISDSSLFFVRFDKNSKIKSHFLVMLTYSLGEFLIVLGLMFLMI
ncbi:MAG: lysoplasmalogenase [Clostridia bacterium]|nr:lysoplasmalogenase [Clostridia bacterium]